MLLSMTGYGEARALYDRWSVEVEVRTVNNRHLKLHAKISEPYSALEPELEKLVRESVRRGTVQLSIRVDRPRVADDYRLNAVALASYRDQLRELFPPQSDADLMKAVMQLPGIVSERKPSAIDPRDDWPLLAKLVAEALDRLQTSRADEGRAMATELRSLADGIAAHLNAVASRGPGLVAAYQERLLERIAALVADKGVTIEPRDVIREVAVFADRADIAEEVVRLRAHLDQFNAVLDEPESSGRKLEFVVQEMGRETNTIGSKANDVAITRAVVEMKGLIEKIRELILNVE